MALGGESPVSTAPAARNVAMSFDDGKVRVQLKAPRGDLETVVIGGGGARSQRVTT